MIEPHHNQPLPLSITNIQRSIVEEIKKKLPKTATVLHIAITGSRGKGVAAAHSDYDTKVLVLHSKRDYLLQKYRPSWKFETFIDGLELEGTVIDYLRMAKYIQESNMMGYELFAGVPIITTQTARQLQAIWCESYQCDKLKIQYIGMLYGYWKKKIGVVGQGAKITQNKLAFEAVYLALKILFMNSNEREPPPFDALDLIKQTNGTERDYPWIKELMGERIRNKSGDYSITKSFCDLLRKAIATQEAIPISKEKREQIEHQLEDLFINKLVR
jgi:predicted nucleotidyltransferase